MGAGLPQGVELKLDNRNGNVSYASSFEAENRRISGFFSKEFQACEENGSKNTH